MAGSQPLRVDVGPPGAWVALGRGGWLFWHLPRWHDVRVRVEPSRDHGRLVVTAVVVRADRRRGKAQGVSRIAPGDLRDLPLGRLEAIVNSPPQASVVQALFESATAPDFSPDACPAGEAYRIAQRLSLIPAEGDLALPIERGGRLSEDFYAGLAAVYARAVLSERSPVEAIARANDVPTPTVNRWLREARTRGLIAPTPRSSSRKG